MTEEEERKLLEAAAARYDPSKGPTVEEIKKRLKPKLDAIAKAARRPLPPDLWYAK